VRVDDRAVFSGFLPFDEDKLLLLPNLNILLSYKPVGACGVGVFLYEALPLE